MNSLYTSKLVSFNKENTVKLQKMPTLQWLESFNQLLGVSKSDLSSPSFNLSQLVSQDKSKQETTTTNDSASLSRHSSSGLSNLNDLLEDGTLEISNLVVPNEEPRGTKRKLEEIYTLDVETKPKNRVKMMTGQWTAKEEKILLELTKHLAQCELKVIASACQECGVLRGTRAIDKKLKRMIGFSSWKDRTISVILAKVDGILVSKAIYKTFDDQFKKKIKLTVNKIVNH